MSFFNFFFFLIFFSFSPCHLRAMFANKCLFNISLKNGQLHSTDWSIEQIIDKYDDQDDCNEIINITIIIIIIIVLQNHQPEWCQQSAKELQWISFVIVIAIVMLLLLLLYAALSLVLVPLYSVWLLSITKTTNNKKYEFLFSISLLPSKIKVHLLLGKLYSFACNSFLAWDYYLGSRRRRRKFETTKGKPKLFFESSIRWFPFVCHDQSNSTNTTCHRLE